MIKERLRAGEETIVKEIRVGTTGSFVNYHVSTSLASPQFDSVSARPDSVASILANKAIVFLDVVIEENHQ
jgi:hypothetical protein